LLQAPPLAPLSGPALLLQPPQPLLWLVPQKVPQLPPPQLLVV
jgi:hypothetical protein